PRQPGQIVLGSTWPGGPQFIPLGATVTVTGVPGTPRLTVTGFATSVTQSADGWVLPAEIARLRAPGTPPGAQMLYRFRDPAAAGCLAGAVLGGLLAGRLVLAKAAAAYGVGTLGGVPTWMAITAPAALCAVTGIAGLLPSWRAGRLTAVAALAAGRAPRAGR